MSATNFIITVQLTAIQRIRLMPELNAAIQDTSSKIVDDWSIKAKCDKKAANCLLTLA